MRSVAGLLRNTRYVTRVLIKTPAFTLTVILTLAIAIGANSAVFSAIDGILLRPLPYPDSNRLVQLREVRAGSGESGVALARLLDWDRLNGTFDSITGYSTVDASLATGDLPERVVIATVAPRFFETLGAAPAIGRGFIPADHRLGQATTVVYSDGFWRTRLNADPSVVGTAIDVDGQSFVTAGVMPPSFRFLNPDVQSWSSLPVDAPWTQGRGPNESYRTAIGRLKPGVTLDRARADLELVQQRLAEQYPDTDGGIDVSVMPLKDMVVGRASGSLWLLFGAVSVLLLIACVNIAALLLARSTRFEQETAIRYSLGASRASIVARALLETIVLASAGASLGLLVAMGGSRLIRTLAPELPRLGNVAIDWRVLAYTLVAVVGVTLLSGLVPALRTAHPLVSAGGRGRLVSSGRHSVQWLLVGVQVALSVTLLAGAGLLVRSLEGLSKVDAGFDATPVLAFRTIRNSIEYDQYDRVRERIDRILDGLTTIPGVEASANSAYLLPGISGENIGEYRLTEGRADTEPSLLANGRFVSSGYFETLGIPLVSGELCRQTAGTSSSREAMVNRSFVDRYLPGKAVEGLTLTRRDLTVRITGVVGNARERRLDREPEPTVYTCDSGLTPFAWYLVRTTTATPLAIVGAVRAKINEIAPLDAVHDVVPLEERIAAEYAQERLRTFLLSFFAGSALLLACLGLFGTLNYVVSLRRREVGLRVALGAVSGNIIAAFLRNALYVVGLACLVGVGLSFLFTRLLSGMLYGVSPVDPLTLFGVVALVVVVATIAALVPAARAARVDAMVALRDQ